MACCTKKVDERQYSPNYTRRSLTLKFYARHDDMDEKIAKSSQYQNFCKEIEKRISYDARNVYKAPVTENQRYGWLERLADKYTGWDEEILMHRTPYDEMMNLMKITLCSKKFR